MHLVIDHVSEFHEVGHADRSHLVEGFACSAVVELRLAGAGQSRLVGPLVEGLQGTSVEDRSGETYAQFLSGPAEDGLEDLSDIHTRGHAQRVEDYIYGCTVCEERHILYAHNLGDDTLVTMASGHLVTHANLTAFGDIDFSHLDNTIGQFVTDSEVEFLAFEGGIQLLVFREVVEHTLCNESVLVLIDGPVLQLYGVEVDVVKTLCGEVLSLGHHLGAHDVIDRHSLLVLKQFDQFLNQGLAQEFGFLLELGIQACDGLLVLHLGLAVLDSTAVEVLVDNDAGEGGAGLEGSVLHVAGLITEDGLEQFLLGRGVCLTLRGNLTDNDITGLDMCTDTNDTVLVEVLGGILAHVRYIGGELLHTTLGLAHFAELLDDMYGGEEVVTHDTFGEDDSILVVVTFPGDISDLEVITEREFTGFGSVALGEDLSLLYPIAFAYKRAEVDSRILVGTLELRHFILFLGRLEGDELLVECAVVADTDNVGIHIGHFSGALGNDLRTRVANQLSLDTGADDRRGVAHQRHGLAHHVRSHECAVCVIVLQEGDECGSDRGYLAGGDVHEVDLVGCNDGEVGLVTGFHLITDEVSVLVQRGVALCYDIGLFVLGRHIDDIVIIEVDDAVLRLAVGSLDEAKVINLRIDTERGYQTDVRSFRCLNRAEASIVGIMHVAHLESCAVAAQAAGAEGRHTALVCDLRQRVLLVHELAERVRSEIGVDDAGDSLGVDKVSRSEDLVVSHVHALTDSTAHTCQADGELVVELFSDGTYTAVAEVVDIVHLGAGVNQFDQVLDNLDDVLLGEHAGVVRDRHIEFTVDAVASHFTEVVTFLGEEEVLNHLACGSVISRFGITQLAIDIEHGFLLAVSRVFLEGIENDCEVALMRFLLVKQDSFGPRLQDGCAVLRREFRLTLEDDLVTLDGNHLTRIFVNEIFGPCFEHVTGQTAADDFLEFGLIHLNLLGQSEAVKDVLIRLEADGAQERCHGQFLLAVDIGIHDLIDVRSELNP